MKPKSEKDELLLYLISTIIGIDTEATSEIRDLVRRCVLHLPKLEKEIIERKFWKNQNLLEISRKTGINKNLVQSHFERALKSIKEQIYDELNYSGGELSSGKSIYSGQNIAVLRA